MQEPFFIKKIAVLGAGVMGAQIAAQCVNAGIETFLFDLEAKEGNHNDLVNKAIGHLGKLKPSPLATPQTASLLIAKNYADNLADLSSCDLIIEAIAERMDWKEALYQRILPHLPPECVLVSNTSGLSIDALSALLPKEHQAHFCGLHFFNPPRYMHLVELIPSKTTSIALLDKLETWVTRYLGKGVIRAKDTPNFIANRIGVFSLLSTLQHCMAMNMDLDEVDALTGTLLGRPKSASFRTMDVVGLDTLQHVVATMQSQLVDDPWHGLFCLPDWLLGLIKQGYLGQKTNQGIYKKQGSTIEVYDYNSNYWRPSQASLGDEIKAIMKIKNSAERMQALFSSNDKQAMFLSRCFRDLFHYCAYHLEAIADNVRDVDLAMRWGFGWQQGPFETWQLSGFKQMIDYINVAIKSNIGQSIAKLPQWVSTIDEFYKPQGAYAPSRHTFQSRSELPVYTRQLYPNTVINEQGRRSTVVYENEGVCLTHLQDDVMVLGFKSKANTIGQSVLDGFNEALDYAQTQSQGLIIYQNDASNFSSGADLRSVFDLIQNEKYNTLANMIAEFQRLVMRLKYSPIPTVAALRGRALGGGCELIMHCGAVVAGFESYPGLVEIGVGLLPAGGGCKEMALRAANQAPYSDLRSYIQTYFQHIATAQVASSAPEALKMGYLQAGDRYLMHADEVLYAALARVKDMAASNYLPPLKKPFKAAGIEGHAYIQAGLVNWLEGGFISQYDYYLANEIAKVLCGGEVYQDSLVTEDWILKLERETFVRLASNPSTQARIGYLLETGKPLRN
ncbi:MAG: 3-hydroxyacyl-CoA dehydrogenase/enoyl-CoA hydratase family protein [Legionella sp.]|nr:3-hydroxyacyl-CoA dehydrogenase/enoyl-CoA hydratase family protein [Legionella sp.]